MSLHEVCSAIAASLLDKSDQHQELEEVITYSIEVLLSNSISIIGSLIFGGLLGLFRETLLALLTLVVLRPFIGGAHSASPARCAVFTITLVPVLGALSLLTRCLNVPTLMAGYTIIFLIALIVYHRFAPADCPAAPIISARRRRKLKRGSFIVLTAVTTAAFLLLAVLQTATWGSSLMLSVLWCSFAVTPAGQSFFGWVDNL